MSKTIFEEMGGTYEMQGDYLIPRLAVLEGKKESVDIWGQRHKCYLKQNHRVLHMNLMTSGKLNSYLADIDEQAKEMFSRLVKEYAYRQGVTEQLKANKPLEWVQKMNNIRNTVNEVINTELIYV